MDLSTKSILVCDDSILMRKQLKDVINSFSSGATFIDAANGQEAVEKYSEFHPDLVFLDIVMPVKDGTSAVEDIIAENPDARIVIVSSVGTQRQIKNAIEAGAKDFIQKPMEAAQVQKVVESHLGGK